MQNPSRKHHYIPVFLTRAWADEGGMVVRYSKHRSVNALRVHPRAVFWKCDLYRLPMNQGADSQRIEDQFLRNLDCAASRIHKRLVEDDRPSLTPSEKIEWSIFLLSILLRSPQNVEAQKRRMNEYWSETVKQISYEYTDLRRANDPPTFAEFAQTLHPKSSEQYGLEILPTLIANRKITDFISSLHWSVFDLSRSKFSLLLSDDPVFIPTGLENDGSVIMFPISPDKLFVVANQDITLDRIGSVGSNNIIRRMNEYCVEGAREFIVSRDNRQQSFIERRFGINVRQPVVAKISAEEAGSVANYVVKDIRGRGTA